MKFNRLYYILITFLFFHAQVLYCPIAEIAAWLANRNKKPSISQPLPSEQILEPIKNNQNIEPIKNNDNDPLHKNELVNQFLPAIPTENDFIALENKQFQQEVQQEINNPILNQSQQLKAEGINLDKQLKNDLEEMVINENPNNLTLNNKANLNNNNKVTGDQNLEAYNKSLTGENNKNLTENKSDILGDVLSQIAVASLTKKKELIEKLSPAAKNKLSDRIRNSSFTLPEGTDKKGFSDYITQQVQNGVNSGMPVGKIMQQLKGDKNVKSMLGGQEPSQGLLNSLSNFAKAATSQKNNNNTSRKSGGTSTGGRGPSSTEPLSFNDYTAATTQTYNDNFNTSSASFPDPLGTFNTTNTLNTTPEQMQKIKVDGIKRATLGITRVITKKPNAPKQLIQFKPIKQRTSTKAQKFAQDFINKKSSMKAIGAAAAA